MHTTIYLHGKLRVRFTNNKTDGCLVIEDSSSGAALSLLLMPEQILALACSLELLARDIRAERVAKQQLIDETAAALNREMARQAAPLHEGKEVAP